MVPLVEYRDKWLPYRMQSIETMPLWLRLLDSWESASSMELYVKGELLVEGKVSALTNPAIESGVLHARALLEFLGLKLSQRSSDRLTERKKKIHKNDTVMEDYGLSCVTVDQAVAKYPGDRLEAEAGLAAPIVLSNSWAAHNSAKLPGDPEQNLLLHIETMGIPSLVVFFFYTPLGLEAPICKHASRPKPGGEGPGGTIDA